MGPVGGPDVAIVLQLDVAPLVALRPSGRPSLLCLFPSRPSPGWRRWCRLGAELTDGVLLSSGLQQAAMTMIDGLMTELCKSFNPFIELDGWTGGRRGEE